ncbi:MAG: glycosyltransferase [Defluviitaleaceae bacterium]|nr:glycosyltransferase [Defluviitaleaceae bacterium]
MDISVVIPVYNRADELRLTLQSLTRQTLPANRFEVIIADDGSAEDIQGVLKEFPALTIIYTHQPDEGFRVAAARNLGADQARGDIIVYSDNGILLKSSTLEKHLQHHKAEGETLAALANMRATGWDTDKDKARELLETHAIDDAINIMKAENMNDGREGYFADYGTDVSAWYIPWLALWGGQFSVNTGFVKKHNIRWNEIFTSWGGEDNEYGIQLCNAGAQIRFFEDIEVAHYPTPGSKAVEKPGEDFATMYEKVKQRILYLHPTLPVKAWYEIGRRANDPELRMELFKSKGWN